MKNFIFISPNFPANYWLFCRELKADGINVLGIGDQPYGELSEGLRESLSEYYKVDDLEDYGQVYRGAAFLASSTGRSIGWSPTTSIGWSGTPSCAPTSTSPPASSRRTCPG